MREFLEKDKVRKVLDEGWARGIYPRTDIMLLHKFTEQEIVKPYFEKLKEEIQQEVITHCGTGEEVIQAYVDGLTKVVQMIDKILSEQGN